ncbi:MAG TPA: DUF4349 domain-containing protein [Solirubrobacteraceae bacterium]|nr:DUF4349 domain-containing protein [Solirubrobacteraceae bacterium]
MRVIRFPGSSQGEAAGLAAGERLDALLGGEIPGAEGVALRTLGSDVRALAPAMAPEFERELQARVEEWSAEGRAARLSSKRARPRRTLNERLARLRVAILASPRRALAFGGAGVTIAAVLAVIALSGGFGQSRGGLGHSLGGAGEAMSAAEVAPRSAAAEPSPGTAGPASQTFRAAGAAPGRLQQLAASVTLAPAADGVQRAAEAASRLAVSDGGFVEQSHVQVRSSGGPSEAQLRLQIPSAKLASAIAALGRIAPERSVNQESEDITSAYDGAKRRLGDAEAVRRALLRALAAATSEGEIDSLRERLAANRTQIAEYRSQVRTQAHRAATSELEVTIAGSGGSASGRSTLDRGLHDAGHVLAVAGAVALVALAVLVPLAVVAFVLEALRRAWRRRRREAALDA